MNPYVRGYLGGTPEWDEWKTGHSLIIDRMWVYTDASNQAFRIEVSLIEGNGGRPGMVRQHPHTWDDIQSLLPSGSGWISGSKKIFGFGIDLDESGNPIYDSSRLHFVGYDFNYPKPMPVAPVFPYDPDEDPQQLDKMVTYARLLRSNGGPKVTFSTQKLQFDNLPDGMDDEWSFPKGMGEDIEIVIDLLYKHPRPITGIELIWRDFVPKGYQVLFAGADGQYEDASVPDIGEVEFPEPPTKLTVPVSFPSDGNGASVRFVKLLFPSEAFEENATMEKINFNYFSPYEDDDHNC